MNYSLIQGTFSALPVLTAAEREALLGVARAQGATLPPALQKPATRPVAAFTALPAPGSDAGGAAYAASALAGEAEKVRTCPVGGRNHTLNTAAFKVGQYVASGLIDEGVVVATLTDAGLAAGLSHGEISATIHSGLTAGAMSPKLPPDRSEQDDGDVDLSRLVDAVHATPTEGEEADDGGIPDDPGPIPEHLARIPGFISEVMDFTLDVSPYPNKILAFCGALSLQAHLAARKVRDPGDNRTNFYLLALANPGAGKDWPRKVNVKVMHEIGQSHQIANRFASGEGLQDALAANPAMLFQPDEIDSLFQSINKSKDARHESTMAELLTLYTSASTAYATRKKSGCHRNEDAQIIDQPCLNLLGTAPPQHYYESLSERMLTNGLFARMLVVEAGRRGHGKDAKILHLPRSIIDAALWWLNYRPIGPDGKPDNMELRNPIPTVVPMSEGASEVLAAWREESDTLHAAADRANNTMVATVWGRTNETARKLALLYAVSVSRPPKIIDRAAAEWAVAFTRHQARRALFMAHMYSSENLTHARKQAIVRLLQATKKHCLQKSALIRRTQGMSPRERDDALADLETSNMIRTEVIPTLTKPKTMIHLRQQARFI